MNKFIVVRYQSKRDAVLLSLRSHFLDEIPFHAETVHIYDFPKAKILLACAEPAVSGFSSIQHTSVDETREVFLTFDGVPFLERQDFSRGWAQNLLEHIEETSATSAASDILGAYCLAALIDNGDLYAFGDFSGLSPIFYYQKGDCFAVSNRQRLLHAVLNDGQFTFDLRAYSWLTGQGNIIGIDSPYAGVKLLTPGKCVISTQRSVTVASLPTRAWYVTDGVREDFTDCELDTIYDCLLTQMKALGRLPFDSLQLELSGGMDSRTVLALAVASGTIDKVRSVITIGPEGSPEIEIASRLAEAFDLPWKAHFASPQSVDVSSWWSRLREHCFRFEGTVAPPDGLGPPAQNLLAALSGTGGEIYRPHVKSHKFAEMRNLRAVRRLFENYQQKNDPLGLQRSRVTRHQRRMMRRLIRAYAREGARAEDMRYLLYVDSRLPWWAGGLHNNVMGRLRLYPLVNWRVASIVYSVDQVQRQIDRINYETLRRVDRRLVEIPFAGYAWDERLAPHIARHGFRLSREPVISKVTGSAAERKPAARQFMIQAWEEVLAHLMSDGGAPLYDIVDSAAVASLGDARDRVVRSVVTLKQMFALLAIKETTEGRVNRELLGPTPASRAVATNVASMRSLEERGRR